MNLLKKLRGILHRHAVTVKELQDTGAVQAVSPRRSQTESSTSHTAGQAYSAGNMATAFASQLPRKKEDSRVVRPARKAPLKSTPLSKITVIQHMKHGHQALWYRKSVKANVKPEEETDTI